MSQRHLRASFFQGSRLKNATPFNHKRLLFTRKIGLIV